MKHIVIAGAGIAGLAAASQLQQQGHWVTVIEQASAFSEVGAGLQLGPNAVRVMDGWGLGTELRAAASRPERLLARDASSGRQLGRLTLGDTMLANYGADYLTIHRADLHNIFLEAARDQGVEFELNTTLRRWQEADERLNVVVDRYGDTTTLHADVLIGADGVWSATRQQMLRDGKPTFTGHVAYRALVEPSKLPHDLDPDAVTAWLGPRMHAVGYLIRGGQAYNLVVVVERDASGDPENWRNQSGNVGLDKCIQGMSPVLLELVKAAKDWKLWSLHVRPVMTGPHQMAQGRVALIGDAAHAMRPYLAQGAAMAIEDVDQLTRSLASHDDVVTALAECAHARWQRNAQVQARSLRNGEIFHARGPVRLARNLAMRLQGESLMDVPWLYGYGLT